MSPSSSIQVSRSPKIPKLICRRVFIHRFLRPKIFTVAAKLKVFACVWCTSPNVCQGCEYCCFNLISKGLDYTRRAVMLSFCEGFLFNFFYILEQVPLCFSCLGNAVLLWVSQQIMYLYFWVNLSFNVTYLASDSSNLFVYSRSVSQHEMRTSLYQSLRGNLPACTGATKRWTKVSFQVRSCVITDVTVPYSVPQCFPQC